MRAEDTEIYVRRRASRQQLMDRANLIRCGFDVLVGQAPASGPIVREHLVDALVAQSHTLGVGRDIDEV